MKSRLKKAKDALEKMSKEQVEAFLKTKSAELKDESAHTKYLLDEYGVPYMTSIYGSGLSVINNEDREISEEVHMKARKIMANAQHYTELELMFVYAYDVLYYHRVKKVS